MFVKSSKTIKLFLLTPSFLVWFSEKATSILYVLTFSMRWVTWCWNIVHVVNSAYFRYLWEKKRFFFFLRKIIIFCFNHRSIPYKSWPFYHRTVERWPFHGNGWTCLVCHQSYWSLNLNHKYIDIEQNQF